MNKKCEGVSLGDQVRVVFSVFLLLNVGSQMNLR